MMNSLKISSICSLIESLLPRSSGLIFSSGGSAEPLRWSDEPRRWSDEPRRCSDEPRCRLRWAGSESVAEGRQQNKIMGLLVLKTF